MHWGSEKRVPSSPPLAQEKCIDRMLADPDNYHIVSKKKLAGTNTGELFFY
jgi:hypothetical protein